MLWYLKRIFSLRVLKVFCSTAYVSDDKNMQCKSFCFLLQLSMFYIQWFFVTSKKRGTFHILCSSYTLYSCHLRHMLSAYIPYCTTLCRLSGCKIWLKPDGFNGKIPRSLLGFRLYSEAENGSSIIHSLLKFSILSQVPGSMLRKVIGSLFSQSAYKSEDRFCKSWVRFVFFLFSINICSRLFTILNNAFVVCQNFSLCETSAWCL